MSLSRAVVAAGPRATEEALFAELARLVPAKLGALAALPGPVRIVVPSGSLRVHVLAEMALRRRSWLGVEVATLRRVALSIFEQAGETPPRGGALLPILVSREAAREPLLAKPLEPLEGGFAPLVGTVSDLLDAGLDAVHGAGIEEFLRSDGAKIAFTDRPRAEAVVRVAARVARGLEREGAVAGAGLYRRGADLLGRRPAIAPACSAWLVHGFADATGSALDFIEALARTAPTTLLLDLPDSSAGGARTLAEPFGASLRTRLLGGATPATAPGVAEADLDAFSTLGEAGEAREVARRIRDELGAGGSLRPERIGVVARDLAPHLPALRRAFEAGGIPFSVVGGGSAAPERRSAQALVRTFDRREKVEADFVLDLLASDLTSYAPVSDLRVALHVLGATSLAEMARLDAERTGDVRLPVRQISENGDGDLELRRRIVTRPALAALVHGARRLIRALERIPERSTSRVLVGSALRLAGEALPEQGSARKWLQGSMTQLAGDLPPDFRLFRHEFAELLARLAEGIPGLTPGGQGGGVQVLSVTAARARTFDRLFLIGLNRGAFPRQVSEDPLLPDAVRRETRTLLQDLQVKEEGHHEERFLFDQLIAAAPRVVLSFVTRSDDATERLVSPLLDRLSWRDQGTQQLRERWRVPVTPTAASAGATGPVAPIARLITAGLAGDRARWAAELPEALAEARGGSAVTPEDQRLARLRHATLDEIDPDRRTPEGRRRARQLGPFFGRIGRGALIPATLWVTRVQEQLGCGWKAFLAAQLGLEPLPDASRALPNPLDPLQVGIGVHRLLERALRAGLVTPVPRRLEEALAREPAELPFPDDDALAAEALPVAEEILAEAGHARWGFQSLFARALVEHARVARIDWQSATRRVAAVEVEGEADLTSLGTPRRLAFRADRVDVVGERVELVDYKAWSPDRIAERAREGKLAAAMAAGRDLQPAAYVAALAGRPATGRFLALGPAADDAEDLPRSIAVDESSQTEMAALARAVAVAAAAGEEGRFLPRLVDPTGDQRSPVCRYCLLLEACLQEDSGARLRLKYWAEDRRREGIDGLDAGDRAEVELFLLADPLREGEP